MTTLDSMVLTDEVFLDAVAELLNIGMGQAAKALSEMTNDEIRLSVPCVQLLPQLEAANLLESKFNSEVSGVLQRFKGDAFDSDVLLLFPEKKSLDLVAALINEETTQDNLTDMEQEAMIEVGNVILNACICSIADIFQKEVDGSIPEFVKGDIKKIISTEISYDNQKDCVLLLNMDFAIDTKHIEGYVTFLMDLNSVAAFKNNIESYING